MPFPYVCTIITMLFRVFLQVLHKFALTICYVFPNTSLDHIVLSLAVLFVVFFTLVSVLLVVHTRPFCHRPYSTLCKTTEFSSLRSQFAHHLPMSSNFCTFLLAGSFRFKVWMYCCVFFLISFAAHPRSCCHSSVHSCFFWAMFSLSYDPKMDIICSKVIPVCAGNCD